MSIREKIVQNAVKWVGTTDNSKIVSLYNSFIRANSVHIGGYPRYAMMQSEYPWCAAFASVVGIESDCAMDVTPVEMSCSLMIRMFKELGRWIENDDYVPSPGDYIFFDWEGEDQADSEGCVTTDHIGIVEYVDNGIIHTIEGNSRDMVRRKQYPVGSRYICGFGVIESVESTDAPRAEFHLPEISYGSKNKNAVKCMQALLNLHAGCDKLDVDGGFGVLTRSALIEFQVAHGLEQDAVCGCLTWSALVAG